MTKTARGLIEHCKKAVSNNVKYVYGAKMEVLTRAQIQSLQNTYGKGCVWDSDLNKAGYLCCDCSGLISSYTGIVRGSSNYNATATASVSLAVLKADWTKYVGWGLWMSGHIGVVSDKEGYYYAMDGSARNMVHYPLTKQGWSKVIKLCDINYMEVEDMTKEEVKAIAAQVANDMVYKYADKVYNAVEEVPDWGKATVEKLISKGALKGTDKGLELSYTLLRLLVINDRAGLYD